MSVAPSAAVSTGPRTVSTVGTAGLQGWVGVGHPFGSRAERGGKDGPFSADALPVGLLAHERFEHLAAGVAGQWIGAHGDVLRDLEVREVFLGERQQLLRVHVAP